MLGVPDGAAAVHVLVDLPGRTARQRTVRVDATTAFNRLVPIDVR